MSYEASCQHMIVMQAVCGTQQVPYQGQMLDLEQPFRRATMHELVQEALGEVTCHAIATETTSKVAHDMLS
jgi:lysyl-tRNA synthetase class II